MSSHDGQMALHLDRVSVRYGKTTAAEAVSFAVPKGSVFALLGRNGAGKSSLIRCLLGQQRAQEGAATIFGEDPWSNRARLMARLGVVPEEPDAPPDMTARQLAAFCFRLYPSWDGKGVETRLRRFAVPGDVPFARLSKGQKGQLALALALGSLPELLVLDDPTLGLDVVARKALFEELVDELAERGTTVLLTSHDLAGVEAMADRVGILKEGRLLVDEPLDDLKARFRRVSFGRSDATPHGSDVLKALSPLALKQASWGAEALVSGFSEEAFARFAEAPGVSDAEASPLSLEEIFIALCGEEGGRP
ncbi:MAG: ABC transporter ATP-binding protein [Acidobacteriota bacterium]